MAARSEPLSLPARQVLWDELWRAFLAPPREPATPNSADDDGHDVPCAASHNLGSETTDRGMAR